MRNVKPVGHRAFLCLFLGVEITPMMPKKEIGIQISCSRAFPAQYGMSQLGCSEKLGSKGQSKV